MKIAVIGASGNVGTAVLRALRSSREVDQVIAVARRIPDTKAEPYDSASWKSIDIGDQAAQHQLREAFDGVDGVIHLAWLIQPNRRRELMRSVNVDGTGRVAEAAAAAGARALVVASSVGAYSPARTDDPHDEQWPTEGIATSHYSVDKAAQERLLDLVETKYPQLSVARMRTALVFQSDAGAEIQRLFLGPLVPTRLIGRVRLPLIPLPQGLRLQAVHADDAARAYVQAVTGRARGAFNIAADDVLATTDLADVLRSRRALEVRPAFIRAAMALAYRARLIPADPGWLDMGMQVPVMDTSRAKSELGWSPTHTARDALVAVIAGMRVRQGTPSAPLRPGDTAMSTTRPEATTTRHVA